MSLLQKLSVLKEEKLVQKKTVETHQKLQTLTETSEKLDELTGRHSKIVQLLIKFGEARENTSKSLEDYKNQKETLKNIYEDGKEIWNEQGVNSLEELMTENAAEPELIKYRETGRRGPLTEKDPNGETGKLYSDASELIDTEKELLNLLPENLKKLSFSSVKSKETGLTNREDSINQINEYLATLTSEIESLKKEKATLYIETPEGKREAISKCDKPDFRDVRLDTPTNFRIPITLIELSEQIGAESIKEVYSKQLSERFIKEAWTKTDPKDQKSIDNYSELAKVDKMLEVGKDYKSAELAKQDALNHLEKIFSEPDIINKLNSYGIYGGLNRGRNNESSNDELRKYEGWSSARVMADRYLYHINDLTRDSSSDSFRGSYSDLVDLYETNINKSDNRNSLERLDNPEFVKASFNNYEKLFTYIATQTNEQTGFVGTIGTLGEVHKKLRGPELRKEIGFVEGRDTPERFLKVDPRFIQENGGLRRVIDNSRSKNDAWEKRKQSLFNISKAAMDLRWVQESDRYFKGTNFDILEEVNNLEKLITNLKLAAASEQYLPVAKFATRKIKIESDGNATDLVDLTAKEDYETYSKELDSMYKERQAYCQEQTASLNKEIITLQKKIFIWNRDEQLAPVQTQYNFFKNYENTNNNVDPEKKRKELTPEQLTKVKHFEEKKNNSNNNYKKTKEISNDFFSSFKRPGFILKIDKKDPLAERELTVEGLFPAIRQRMVETETILNNLPEDKKTVWETSKKSLDEIIKANEKYTQTIKENSSSLR